MVTTRPVYNAWSRNQDGGRLPAQGVVEFTPSDIVTDASTGELVVRGPIIVPLDAAGQIHADIPVTDDPAHDPQGWWWHVVERIDAQVFRAYDLELATSTAGLDLSLVVADEEPPMPAATTFVSLSAFDAQMSRKQARRIVQTEPGAPVASRPSFAQVPNGEQEWSLFDQPGIGFGPQDVGSLDPVFNLSGEPWD